MNRLNWFGNDGGDVRRGERFELGDEKRAQSLLEAGYISGPLAANQEEDTGVEGMIAVNHDDGDIPDASWTIADIKGWMDAQNAGYPASASKAHLLDLVAGLDET